MAARASGPYAGGMPTLLDVVNQGWADHAKDPAGVLGRLADALPLVTEPGHVPAFAALAAHVAGEHLGRYDDGLALLDRLAARDVAAPASPEAKVVRRQQAALQLAAGRRGASDRLEAAARVPGQTLASSRIRVAAFASAMLAGQGRPDAAGALLDEALGLAADALPSGADPAARALAVTGNNMACALEEKADRTPAETSLMVRAAAAGLRWWSVAGTWLETERAHYRLAASLRKAGRAAEAVVHARACLRIVEANGGDPFERCFAHEGVAAAAAAAGDVAGARAARDAAAALLPAIEDAGARAAATEAVAALDRG